MCGVVCAYVWLTHRRDEELDSSLRKAGREREEVYTPL